MSEVNAVEFLNSLLPVLRPSIAENPQSQYVDTVINSMLTLSRIPHNKLFNELLVSYDTLDKELKLIAILVVQQLNKQEIQNIHYFYTIVYTDLETEAKELERLESKQRLVCQLLANYINSGATECEEFLQKLCLLDSLPAIYISSLISNTAYHDKLFQTAIQLLPKWEREAFQIAYVELFPVFFKQTTELTNRLKITWDTVCKMWSNTDTKVTSYALLCQFYPNFFDLDGNNFVLDLRGDNTFWEMILEGMLSEETFTKRRSIYLLKRTIDVSKLNPSVAPPQWTKYFSWSEELSKVWTNLWDVFFMIFETMEEFSVHLIVPIWSKIFTLFPKHGETTYLHPAWLELLLLQSFNHSNLGIQRLCLAAFFTIDFNTYQIFWSEKFACDTIFDYFVSAKMYWKKEKMGHRMLEFYPKYFSLLTRDQCHQAVTILLIKLRNNWGRATISYLIASLKRVNFDFGDDIIKNLEIVYETHVTSMIPWLMQRLSRLLVECMFSLCDFKNCTSDAVWRFLSKFDDWSLPIDIRQEADKWLSDDKDRLLSDLQGLLKSIFSTSENDIAFILCKRFAYMLKYVSFSQEQISVLLVPYYENLEKIYTQTYGDELMPFKSLYLALHLHIPSHVVPEIISFLDSALQFPLSIDNDQIKNMKVEYVSIYAKMIAKLTQINDVRIHEFLTRTRARVIEFLTNVHKTTRQFAFDFAILVRSAMEISKALSTADLKQWTQEELREFMYAVIKAPVLRVGTDSQPSIMSDLDISLIYRTSFVNQWSTVNTLLAHLTIEYDVLDTIDRASDALDLITLEDIVLVMDCIRIVMPIAVQKDDSLDVDRIFENMFTALKSSKSYNETAPYSAFAATLFDPIVIENHRTIVDKFWLRMQKQIELTPRLSIPFAYELAQLLASGRAEDFCVKTFIDILLFSCSVSEDDELEQAIFPTDSNQNSYPPIVRAERYVRAILLPALQRVIDDRRTSTVHALVQLLIQRVTEKTFNKSMAMPNSVPHRLKVRLWTVLVMCTAGIESADALDMDKLFDVLGLDTLPSVRNIMETFFAIVFLKFPTLIPTLLERLANMNARAQCLASLMIISGYYLIYCPDEHVVQAWKSVGMYLLQYTNIHQYAVRSIAQLFLHAFLQRAEQMKQRSPLIYEQLVHEEFFNLPSLQSTDQFLLSSHSVINWMSKFQDIINVGLFKISDPDYLLNNVAPEGEANPYSDVTPQVVFKSCSNELLLFYSLCGCASVEDERDAKLRIKPNAGTTLKNPLDPKLFEGKHYNYSAVGVSDVEWAQKFLPETIKNSFQGESQNKVILDKLNETAPKQEDTVNFQRKITPWTELELSNEINPRLKQASRTRQPLIVMATYVDKIPNLAGLSRTCEIFSAEKLVMASTKVVNNDMFKSIAVTAQNWLPMDECAEEFVVPYLQTLRNNGYTIVGVEQTSTSVPIQNFEFPDKCVIVLGKEKEGIPAETINAIDVCVEIPQFGMIRSLNVHVSASIFMYEYTKQKLMK